MKKKLTLIIILICGLLTTFVYAFFASGIRVNDGDDSLNVIVGTPGEVSTIIFVYNTGSSLPLVPIGLSVDNESIDELFITFYILWQETDGQRLAPGHQGRILIDNIIVMIDNPLLTTNYLNYEITENYDEFIYLHVNSLNEKGQKYNTKLTFRITLNDANTFDDYLKIINQNIIISFDLLITG